MIVTNQMYTNLRKDIDVLKMIGYYLHDQSMPNLARETDIAVMRLQDLLNQMQEERGTYEA